ncbi:hypothetical protein C2S51_024503 [Perilla frutescens var. frutescens]|nr:hypothetical protein C2S51_024503 [Perilla frutescens var. frutescens]
MSAPVEVVAGALHNLAIHVQTGMEGISTAVVELTDQVGCNTNCSNVNDHHGVCAICLNKIVLQETALVKGCEHAYCVTCILRWASCKKEPTCPQCKNPFEFLNIHRALDGSIHDYMFEESVCLLLRASWFKPLVEAEKEELEKVEDYYCYYDDDDEEEDPDEFYIGRSLSLRIGNRRWGDNGFVRAGRQEARPTHCSSIHDSGAGPSRQPKTKESPAKELVGRRAKRALKREAADKHQQRLARILSFRWKNSMLPDGVVTMVKKVDMLLLFLGYYMNMDSAAARFIYNPEPESEDGFSGILEIHVHHARNIHNICIYEKQDVYAKFSLTYNPDETISTRIIIGGGKNPEFNEDLIMKINQSDAVLKCEIWMLSRAKNLMDDQLLGFVLVPISSVSGKGRLTQDFHLSSTDLFHSPAGTIKLSLFLNAKTPTNLITPAAAAAATSELLLDNKISEDYCRIEFPDVNIVSENQQMVSEYFAKNGTPIRPWLEKPDGSFLHLGAAPPQVEDYEMAANSSDEYAAGSVSTMTSLSDDRNSADSMEKKGLVFADFSTSLNDNAETPTPTGASKKSESDECLEEREEDKKGVRNVEESAMQQQIVDMYMRSMQQFTDSLAKMKLPMDLDKPAAEDEGDLIQNSDDKIEVEKKMKKKDTSRVFYGSRAFF